jgi:hypothetical protein
MQGQSKFVSTWQHPSFDGRQQEAREHQQSQGLDILNKSERLITNTRTSLSSVPELSMDEVGGHWVSFLKKFT